MENIYDNEEFYSSYKKMREENVNANDLIENPIIKEMLPDVKNKAVLDLGCGNGNMSKYLVYLGAKSVVASDISKNMLEEAKEKYNSEKIEYLNLPMEEIDTINKKFDVVYSSLAFHYVKDFNKLINDIYNLLNDGGILIFSQESPLNTSSIVDSKSDNKITMNGKNYYLLSDYNNEGLRESKIAGSIYHKYHRSYATLVNTLVKNNFEILEMRDSIASDEAIKICDKYKNQLDKPYFTFVKARKISK